MLRNIKDKLERKDAAIAELVGALKRAKETTYSDTLFDEWGALIAKHEPKQEGK